MKFTSPTLYGLHTWLAYSRLGWTREMYVWKRFSELSIGRNDGTQVLVSFLPLCRDFSHVESKIDYRIAIGQGTCR